MSRARIKPIEGYKPLKFTAKDRSMLDKNPEEGLKRIKAKAQANVIMAMAGAYTGASKSKRQFGDWKTSGGDADADTLYDLPTLRERSRDLLRNNPLAAGAINTKVVNVVGTGLALKSAIDRDYLGLSEDAAEAWQRNAEREYRIWAESPDCDVARTVNFYGLQELAFRSVLENGDAFALPTYVDRPGVLYQLAIQLIEADRCCNENWAQDSATVAAGVEKDESGAPKLYHILNQHPGAMRRGMRGATWTKVPAFTSSGRRNLLHLYRQLRIGQTRGVPDLAPVISALKQLGDYTEAELTAALVSGLFTVFIKSMDGDGQMPGLTTDVTDSSRADTQSIKMGAGAIVGLGENEDISTANPGRPNQAFDPFVQAILRQIGVALELPFEVLNMHFQSSYSAARAALLQAWKFFRARRFWLADAFCRPIYEAWMWEAVAMGRINAPGFLQDPAIRAAYLGSEWIGDAPGALDPLKEGQAAKLYEEMGWKTGTENTAELTGGDWEQKHRQLTREKRLRADAGLGMEPAAPALPPVVDNDEEEQNNDDTNN